jgi:hypothetical protein
VEGRGGGAGRAAGAGDLRLWPSRCP